VIFSRITEVLTHVGIIALLVLLAVTLVYYPELRLLVFITFIVVITVVVFISRRAARKPPKLFDVIADEVRRGSMLFEVVDDEVSRLLEKDFTLYDEFRKQSFKALMESMIIIPIFLWYFIYFYLILPRFVITDLNLKLIAYIVGFVVPYILYVVSEFVFRVKTLTYVLRGYEVYDRGIVSISQYIVIKFPLSKDYIVREYSKRKCIELSRKHGGYTVRFLLYTKNTPKLVEVLSSYGKAEVISD
jgi:uncharacterized membrane protein